MSELKLGNTCGSCIHTNKPKRPREHAAHYEVAKTERWCFLHNRHVTRECTCDDHEGNNRAAKTGFTRIKKYNDRIPKIHKIIEIMKSKGLTEIQIDNYSHITIKIVDDWLSITYGDRFELNRSYRIRTKESSCDIYIKKIFSKLENY